MSMKIKKVKTDYKIITDKKVIEIDETPILTIDLRVFHPKLGEELEKEAK